MRGRLSVEECTAKLGGLNMTPAQLRDVGRVVLTGCGTALHAGMVGEYLLEKLAHVADRSGIRERIPPSQYAHDERHARLRHQPERGDRRHVRRAAREPAQRLSEPRHLQQRREHDRAGKRWRRLHACRAGDRRGRDQVLHLAGRHPDPGRLIVRPDAPSFDRGRHLHHRSARSAPGKNRSNCSGRATRSRRSPKNMSRRRACCFSAGSSISRSRSKPRSR